MDKAQIVIGFLTGLASGVVDFYVTINKVKYNVHANKYQNAKIPLTLQLAAELPGIIAGQPNGFTISERGWTVQVTKA